MTIKLNKRIATGFSLIELVIVLIVLGILASIAIPQYNQHVIKARRTDAKLALVDLAARMERYHAEHQSFVGATLGVTGTILNTHTSSEGFYSLNILNVSANSYLLTATPVGSQLTDDSLCGTLSINQLGITAISGTGKVSQCW